MSKRKMLQLTKNQARDRVPWVQNFLQPSEMSTQETQMTKRMSTWLRKLIKVSIWTVHHRLLTVEVMVVVEVVVTMVEAAVVIVVAEVVVGMVAVVVKEVVKEVEVAEGGAGTPDEFEVGDLSEADGGGVEHLNIIIDFLSILKLRFHPYLGVVPKI